MRLTTFTAHYIHAFFAAEHLVPAPIVLYSSDCGDAKTMGAELCSLAEHSGCAAVRAEVPTACTGHFRAGGGRGGTGSVQETARGCEHASQADDCPHNKVSAWRAPHSATTTDWEWLAAKGL